MKTVQLLCASSIAAATLTAPALANDATPKLHPLEKACVEYQLAGQMMNGTITRCHRDFAYETYEIRNTTMGIAGFTQTENKHNITVGEDIYSIDLDTNSGTKTANPMYDGLVAALANSDPQTMGDQFVTAMGFTATGASKTIADTSCNMYSSGQMGTVCMTSSGVMLEQDFMGNTQTAISVSLGEGGDDANYTAFQNATITDGPDLSNGLQGLIDQMGQQ